MKRYVLRVEYHGKGFYGSQKQEGKRTVHGELEEAMNQTLSSPVELIFSGRTDRYVHALAQVVVFDAVLLFKESVLLTLVQKRLPSDIRLLTIKEMPLSFHPRFCSKQKTYRYLVKPLSEKTVFNSDEYYFISRPFDSLSRLQTIMSSMIGTHDFTSFKKSDCTNHEVKKTIYRIEVFQENTTVVIEICGSGFLKNMVRIMVEESLREYFALEESGHIEKRLQYPSLQYQKHLAPPQGLYLKEVVYDDYFF